MRRGNAPRELNRLDIKNWTRTPPSIGQKLARSIREVAAQVDAFIVLDQTDVPQTGVVTSNPHESKGCEGSHPTSFQFITDGAS